MSRNAWAYRAGQAVAATRARMRPVDVEEALAALPEGLRPLFLSMAARDQRHSLQVLRRLREAQADIDPVLAQAALLHDVGKAEAPLGTAGRSLLVLAEALGVTAALERAPGLGRRVARYRRHPEVGAQRLRAAGASAVLVEVVAEHQASSPRRAETLSLQAADGRE